MIEKKAKITSKGQVTIPKKIRDKFGLEPGQEVIFSEEASGIRMRLSSDKSTRERLRELRNEFTLTKEDIRRMIKESKEDWAKRDIP